MLRHGLTWLAIFGVIALMFLQLPPMVAKQDVVMNTYSALVEVDALAKQKYVEPVDGRRLVDGAVRGMMLQLDPYSGYIPSSELASFERRSAGDYIGVGLELGLRDGRLTIISPIEGSPAAHAGLMAGDIVQSIDGRDAKDLSVFEAEDRLVGQPKTTVALKILRNGIDGPLAFDVKRDHVTIPTVRGFGRDADLQWRYMIDDEAAIAYIRISNFRETTMRDFDAVLKDLLKKGIHGLILDLRFNPGGLMDSAIAMVDRFVSDGLVLSTVTRRHVVHEYPAHAEGTIDDLPLAVLVNSASASSAEIVAGSLQDHTRAVIVGERTFGKGSVQHLIPLTDHHAAVKLTVAYYCLPSGRIIHRKLHGTTREDWGIRPDIEVKLTDLEICEIQNRRRGIDMIPLERQPKTTADDDSMNESDHAFGLGVNMLDVAGPLGLDDWSDFPGVELIVDRQIEAALAALQERSSKQTH